MRFMLCGVCLALLAALAVPAQAGDGSWNKVKERGELIIGLAAHYPPFESRNEKTGELEGFDVGLAKALAAQLGVQPKFVDAEWQGLLGGLAKGDFDVLITCMSKSEARGKEVAFSDVYYKLADVIVVRKGDTAVTGKDDLRGKVVGVQLGSGSEQLVDKLAEQGAGFKEIKRYNYNPEAFLDLKAKRIDALVVGYAYAVNQIKEDPSYHVVDAPLSEAEIVMVLPQGADALVAKLNAALAKLRKNGTYQKIHDRWLKVD